MSINFGMRDAAGRVGSLYCPRGSACQIVTRGQKPAAHPTVLNAHPTVLNHESFAQQRGASLIELIMFIVIVSTALAGILLVMNQTTRGSADPLLRKQSIAVAYSLLDEIALQAFANPVGGFTGAATQANRALFDDVMDYNGFASAGIFPLAGGAAIVGLEQYNVGVAVVPEAAVWNGIAAANVVRINVTVTAPNGDTVTATGYRTAY